MNSWFTTKKGAHVLTGKKIREYYKILCEVSSKMRCFGEHTGARD